MLIKQYIVVNDNNGYSSSGGADAAGADAAGAAGGCGRNRFFKNLQVLI